MPTALRSSASIWLFRIGVPLGWGLFSLLVMGISWAGYAMQGRKSTIGFMQNLGLLSWGVVTFLVVYLARRWPLERKNLVGTACLHFGLGVIVVSGNVGLEYGLGRAFGGTTAYWALFAYKAYIYFLIYWLIVGATIAYDNYGRYRESRLLASQLETQLAQSQLHALKMQLQPHFLFNAHHSIISLMLKGEDAAAIKMLTRLSDLLRLTLDKSHQQVVSLRDELNALDLYLGIQKERYRNRLQVEMEVESEALGAEVPYLLLQPLVENAFKHGIDTVSDGGVLKITARRQANSLYLAVGDNGPGCAAYLSGGGEKGVGLRNTKARLLGLYGENQRLEIHGFAGDGTEIRVNLPFKIFDASPQGLREINA